MGAVNPGAYRQGAGVGKTMDRFSDRLEPRGIQTWAEEMGGVFRRRTLVDAGDGEGWPLRDDVTLPAVRRQG